MDALETARDPIVEELQRILASPEFSHNQRLGSFLRFVIQQKLQGHADQIKETVIGAEVCGRKSDYNPRRDPIVRMEAAKLRARLTEYYLGTGTGDPIRIEIPKGTYIPQWRVNDRRRRVIHLKRVAALALPLCLIIMGIGIWRWTQSDEKLTIAVLPFVNFTADANNDYFSDGVVEDIVRLMSGVEGLEITSLMSSSALKETTLDTREIGRKLNATVLLKGSTRRVGNRLRITTELVRAADGRQLWSNSYDREMQDIFAMQEEIAGSIASALRLKLGTGSRHYPDNLEEYQLYLRGRYALERALSRNAVQYFEQAIALDANYALAHAAIADAFLEMDIDQLPSGQGFARAKVAAEKAMQLDPMLPEAHTALAKVRAREYAWQEAERSFRRAIELNQNSALAHRELGYSLLFPLGRFDEGFEEIRRALAMDPLSGLTNIRLASALLLASRYKEAEDQARKTIALDPSWPVPYQYLGRALYWQEKHAEALDAFQEADQRANEWPPGWLTCAYVRVGRRDQALSFLQRYQQDSPQPRANRRLLQIYACLGDKERAFHYLEKMYAEREPLLPYYLLSPELHWMRSDSRFAILRQKMNLPLKLTSP